MEGAKKRVVEATTALESESEAESDVESDKDSDGEEESKGVSGPSGAEWSGADE